MSVEGTEPARPDLAAEMDVIADHHSYPGGLCGHGWAWGCCPELDKELPDRVRALVRHRLRCEHDAECGCSPDSDAGSFNDREPGFQVEDGRLGFSLAPRLEPLSSPPSGGGTSSIPPGTFHVRLSSEPTAEDLESLVRQGIADGQIVVGIDPAGPSSQLIAVVEWPSRPGGCRLAPAPLLWEGDQA